MRGFNRGDELERRLRTQRPRPRGAFVEALSIRVRESRAARRAGPARVAVAAALTLGMLAALGAVGGLGYAASAAKEAASAVLTPNKPDSATGGAKITAGGDEYRPGYGYGDKNHNHTGPPGLTRRGSVHTSAGPNGETVTTEVNIDEQADLTISVVEPNGSSVQLSERRSRIGQSLGANPRSIRYRILTPRTFPIKLNIPKGQVKRGVVYRIKIVARDPDGNARTVYIPFRA
jgi:hypothetical protein